VSEFKTSNGYTFAIAVNKHTNEADDRVVCWNDPVTGSWETLPDNEAGFIVVPGTLSPTNSIREENGDVIVAERYLFRHVGKPFVWGMRLIDERPDNPDPARAP
jgi:hypothetical protein